MQKLKFGIISFVVLFGLRLFAHGDHHEMDQEQVVGRAKNQVESLVSEAKLPSSWSSAKIVSTEIKKVQGKKRWVVQLENTQTEAASEKRIEIIFTPAGKYISHQLKK